MVSCTTHSFSPRYYRWYYCYSYHYYVTFLSSRKYTRVVLWTYAPLHSIHIYLTSTPLSISNQLHHRTRPRFLTRTLEERRRRSNPSQPNAALPRGPDKRTQTLPRRIGLQPHGRRIPRPKERGRLRRYQRARHHELRYRQLQPGHGQQGLADHRAALYVPADQLR